MLHWPIVDVEKVYPSLSLSNLLLVESALGILSHVLSLKDDEANTSASTWGRLFDEDGLLRDLAIAIEELNDFADLDLEWEPSDQQGSVTVLRRDLVSEAVTTARLSTTSAATAAATTTATTTASGTIRNG